MTAFLGGLVLGLVVGVVGTFIAAKKGWIKQAVAAVTEATKI